MFDLWPIVCWRIHVLPLLIMCLNVSCAVVWVVHVVRPSQWKAGSAATMVWIFVVMESALAPYVWSWSWLTVNALKRESSVMSAVWGPLTECVSLRSLCSEIQWVARLDQPDTHAAIARASVTAEESKWSYLCVLWFTTISYFSFVIVCWQHKI